MTLLNPELVVPDKNSNYHLQSRNDEYLKMKYSYSERLISTEILSSVTRTSHFISFIELDTSGLRNRYLCIVYNTWLPLFYNTTRQP